MAAPHFGRIYEFAASKSGLKMGRVYALRCVGRGGHLRVEAKRLLDYANRVVLSGRGETYRPDSVGGARTRRLSMQGRSDVAAELYHCDVFCGHPKVPVDWDGVVRGDRLKWIQSSAAGLDHLLVPSVVRSEIVVTSASGVLSDQVAEHTVAMVTGLLRGMPTFFRAQQAKEYIRRPDAGFASLDGRDRRIRRRPGGAWRNCLRHSRRGFWPQICFRSISRRTWQNCGMPIGSMNYSAKLMC